MFGRKRKLDDFSAEIDAHLQLEFERQRALGLSEEEARAAARRAFGNVMQAKERFYESGRSLWLDHFWQDVRYGVRTLRKSPGLTAVVALSLALGIGANAAIFSLVDAIILRPLAVPHPGDVIDIDTAASRLTRFGGSSYQDYLDFCNRATSFQALLITQQVSVGMNPAGISPDLKPQAVYGSLVSANYFSALEVQPALGRGFLPEEGQVPNKYPVVVISHSLWSRAFAGDSGVVGKIIKLNGHSFTIIGVAPKSFTGTDLFFRPDFYVPAVMSSQIIADGGDTLTHRDYRSFLIYGRLKRGVSVTQAQAQMNVIMSGLERQYPDSNKDTVAIVRKDMNRRLQGNFVLLPLILTALGILVLLMACSNVASLLLARTTSRLKEISTKLALGATRGRLIRQFLTESGVLAILVCAIGILLAYGSIRGFRALVPYSAAPEGPDFRLDLRVLSSAVIASAAAVFLFGLAPAFTAVKDAWGAVMTTRTSVSSSRSFGAAARHVLIGGQIALSVVLLVVGGLFLRAFSRAQRVDLGFNPNHLLLVTIDPTLQGYSGDQSDRFQQQLLQRVASLSHVQSATLAGGVPFLSGGSWDLSIDGYTAPDGEKFIDTQTNQVGPQYFATMQIPLLYGREFTDRETRKSPGVAIVNETLAKCYITPDGDVSKALGHILRLRDNAPLLIVGVVKDSSSGGRVGTPPPPVFYLPYFEQGDSRATLLVRADGDPSALVSQIRSEIAAVDAEITPASVLTMSSVISEHGLFVPRIVAILGGVFGAVALSLAVIGLYGVVSFMVGRRTQEIGIRMALGEQRSSVLRMVLANGLSLAAVGLAVGLTLSIGATPLLRSLLIGVSPWDPTTFVAICAALGAATVVASWVPASRATRVDPLVALRHE
jgi:putative ABC transport system permease protein